jgi:integrase
MATKLSRIVDETVRTAWVKGWTEEFLKGLKSQVSKEAIEVYCLAQKTVFETEVKRLSEEKAKNQKTEVSEVSWLNSATAHMSQIRNAIKIWQQSIELTELNSYPQKTKDGIVNQHFAMLYMNYPQEVHEKRMQPTKEKKDEQRRNLEPINCLDKYQEVIDRLLESHDYRELTVGLIAATGRRPSEILSTATFTQLGQFEVSFEGQLKAKGERNKYPTFTLVESAKVVDGLLKLRRMPEIKEMKQWELFEIDSGKNSTVNSKVKESFAGLINPPRGEKELSNKNLRAAYAAIAIYLFCPGNHTESLFIKERLGHTGDATASNYEDYQVVDKSGNQLPRGVWVERVKEEPFKPKQIESCVRLRITVGAKEVINDQEFLHYPDQLSRVEELIRLARIGKQYEEGKLVKEVVKVVEVVKEVEKPVEVVKEVEKPVEVVKEVEKPVEEVKSTTTRFEEMSNDELKGCQAPGSALEKIRRSVQAIKVYNGQQAEKKAQWAINVSTLEDLSGCHSKAVREYLDSDEGRLQVTDYNLEKGFGFQHNRGKKGSIKEVLSW